MLSASNAILCNRPLRPAPIVPMVSDGRPRASILRNGNHPIAFHPSYADRRDPDPNARFRLNPSGDPYHHHSTNQYATQQNGNNGRSCHGKAGGPPQRSTASVPPPPTPPGRGGGGGGGKEQLEQTTKKFAAIACPSLTSVFISEPTKKHRNGSIIMVADHDESLVKKTGGDAKIVPADTKQTRFGGASKEPAKKDERSRVLTMKYGKQQMMLIRKRMRVETWLDEQLGELFKGDNEIDVDVDEILDLETVPEKRRMIFDILQKHNCPASMNRIHSFLEEFMEQLDTL